MTAISFNSTRTNQTVFQTHTHTHLLNEHTTIIFVTYIESNLAHVYNPNTDACNYTEHHWHI